MQLDPSLFRGNPVARVLVCVDKMESGEPQGDYLTVYMKEPEAYSGIVSLVNGMDAYFDRMDYPQAYNAYRTFDKPKRQEKGERLPLDAVNEELFAVKRGRLCTFLVQVLFRQNTDWQGVLTWIDGKKTQHFRSTLEMMKLMERAMSALVENGFGEW